MIGGGNANESESGWLRCRVAMTALLFVAACKPPTDARWPADPAAAKRGLAVIERVQCAACHEIKGIAWPKGRTGPPLLDIGDRGLIAGAVPNRPDLLAAFVRNAPAVRPGSPMPPMPVTVAESRDVTAYLYENGR